MNDIAPYRACGTCKKADSDGIPLNRTCRLTCEPGVTGGSQWTPLNTAPVRLRSILSFIRNDEELEAYVQARIDAEGKVCGACGKPWDGEKCEQAKNDWPFSTCYPASLSRE